LPSRPKGADAEPAALTPAAGAEDLPDWLQNLSADTNVSPEPSDEALPAWLRGDADPTTNAPADTVDQTPKWLRSVQSEEQSTLPPWQSDYVESLLPPQEQPKTPSDQQALPDWLRDDTETADSSASTTLPDWLREEPGALRPQDRSSATDLPAPPRSPVEPTPPPADVLQEEVEGIPTWLRDIPDEEIQRVMAEDESDTITVEPFTFEGVEPGAAAETKADATELPAWLSDIDPEPAKETESWLDELATPKTEESSSPQLDDTSLPEWLRDLGDETGSGAASTNAPAFQTPADPNPILPSLPDQSAELPAWLQSSEQPLSSEPSAPVLPSLPDQSVELPAWLQSSEQPAASEPPSDAPEPNWTSSSPDSSGGAGDIPAWLRAEADAPDRSSDLPAWLQSDAAPSPPATGDVPAWLRAEQGDEPAPYAPSDRELPAWMDSAATQARTGAESSDVELPAWMDSAATQAGTSAGEAEPELPAWLQVSTPATEPTVPAASEEAPAWLQEGVSASQSSSPGDDDLPAWLQAEPATAPEPISSPPGEDVPSWLRAEPGPSIAAPIEDLPHWLRPHVPSPSSESSAAASDAPIADDLPPWLRDESGAPLPTAGQPGDANLPEWLRGASIDSPPSEKPSQLPPRQPREPLAPVANRWFDANDEAVADSDAANEGEFLKGMDLPVWLRGATEAKSPETSSPEERSLDWLTRLGAMEDEPVAVATVAPKMAPPMAPARSQSQIAAVALLEQLAATPFPDAGPLPGPARVSIWRRIGIERVLYIALLVALVAALVSPGLVERLQVPPQAPGAAAMFDQIDSLTEQDVVLVGYEWDARRISELRPLEQAVLDQLIRQNVKFVTVSTDPQGVLLSYDLADKLVAEGYRGSGLDYILLGYKPGGELGLRLLAQDFRGPGGLASDFQGQDATVGGLARGEGTNRPLTSLEDMSMILVLADDAVDVQGWMEQIRPSAPDVPITFLLPAEAAPIVQPYTNQPGQNVYHLAGKRGALAYTSLSAGADDAAVAREAGQERLGLAVFVALFLLGAVMIGIAALLTPRKKRT
jgi:hypothetical protein